MAYSLTFFCRSEQEKGSTALASFLPKLTETGDRVLIKHPAADYADQVDACEPATDNDSEMPAAGWLVLQLYVGVRDNADSVIRAGPEKYLIPLPPTITTLPLLPFLQVKQKQISSHLSWGSLLGVWRLHTPC